MNRHLKVGDLCIHKGSICRVTAVERQITGQNAPSRAYMGIPDGTEFNPNLTLTPLYGPKGTPVRKAKSRTASAGSVTSVQNEVKDLKDKIGSMQKRLALLQEVS